MTRRQESPERAKNETFSTDALDLAGSADRPGASGRHRSLILRPRRPTVEWRVADGRPRLAAAGPRRRPDPEEMSAITTPPARAHTHAASDDDVEALLDAGYAAIEQRELGAALEWFERAFDAAPHRAECLHGMGVIALLLHKTDRALQFRALQFLEAAAAQATGSADLASRSAILADLGHAYLSHGDLRHAVKAWQRAHMLSHDPALRGQLEETLLAQFAGALELHAAGDVESAAAICTAIVKLHADHGRALHLLGIIAAAGGRLPRAEQLLRRALEREPGALDTLVALAEVLYRRGAFESALGVTARVLDLEPGHPSATLLTGLALAALRHDADAERVLRQFIGTHPDSADALCRLGLVIRRIGSPAEARELLARAAALGGAQHEAAFLLGEMTLSEAGPDAAISYYDRQLDADHANPLALTGRGMALEAQGEAAAAVPSYLQALRSDPGGKEAGLRVGGHFARTGAYEAAGAVYQHVLQRHPDHAVLRMRDALLLPVIHASADTMRAARERYTTRIESLLGSELRLRPWELPEIAPPLHLAYQGENDRDLQMKLAQLVRKACPEVQFTAPHAERPRTGNRIRVGFLSAHLGTHAIGTLNRGFVARLDRKRFEVVVIHTADALNDPRTRAIDCVADGVVRLPADFLQAQTRLAELALDILFFTDIGMDTTSCYFAHGRYAPVQAVSWGHPSTTGIPSVDWFVSAIPIEPADAASHYSERLERLPVMPTWYPRPAVPAAVGRAALGLTTERRLYACPRSLFRLHPDFDFLLDAILRADPQSLVVLSGDADDMATRLVKARLEATLGPRARRLHWLPRLSEASYVAMLSAVDVVLDPIRFGGGTSTFQSFAAGTPLVTLPSAYMRSRVALGCYTQMGFNDLVARDADDYVAIALRLANDTAFARPAREAIEQAQGALFERDDAIEALAEFFERALAAR